MRVHIDNVVVEAGNLEARSRGAGQEPEPLSEPSFFCGSDWFLYYMIAKKSNHLTRIFIEKGSLQGNLHLELSSKFLI